MLPSRSDRSRAVYPGFYKTEVEKMEPIQTLSEWESKCLPWIEDYSESEQKNIGEICARIKYVFTKFVPHYPLDCHVRLYGVTNKGWFGVYSTSGNLMASYKILNFHNAVKYGDKVHVSSTHFFNLSI